MESEDEFYGVNVEVASESGTGLREKHPVHFLRVSCEGRRFGITAPIQSFEQEDSDSPSWFEICWRGFVGGLLNDWTLRVEGVALEPICLGVAKGTQAMLKIGDDDNSLQKTRITAITLSEWEFTVEENLRDID